MIFFTIVSPGISPEPPWLDKNERLRMNLRILDLIHIPLEALLSVGYLHNDEGDAIEFDVTFFTDRHPVIIVSTTVPLCKSRPTTVAAQSPQSKNRVRSSTSAACQEVFLDKHRPQTSGYCSRPNSGS
jgi:hypothetical protein